MIEMEVFGVEDVEKGLHFLPEALARGVVRTALRRAAEFMKGKVIANIHSMFQSRSGDFVRSIVVKERIDPGRNGGSIVRAFVASEAFRAGVNSSRGSFGRSKAPYPFFWEKGFEHVGRASRSKLGRKRRGQAFLDSRGILRKGRRGQGEGRDRTVGKFMRKEFMKPAFEDNAQAALAIIVAELRSGFDAAVDQVFAGKRAA